MTAIHALLHGLIDYAGLFPPSAHDMMTAVRNYSSYQMSEHAYALGRFVLPAQRLEEFIAAFNEACCYEQGKPWLLSVIVGPDVDADLNLMAKVGEGAVFIDAVEIKAVDDDYVNKLAGALPSGMDVYLEFAPEQSSHILPIAKKLGYRAKIRTGGVTADAISAVESVASFISSCAKEAVPFKATAGLHHPLRSYHRLTYEPDSASATMHGFVNLFVAAMVAFSGHDHADVIHALREQDAGAFQWTQNELVWREHRFSSEQIKNIRRQFAISFGSCSFTEPIEDLMTLGWLA